MQTKVCAPLVTSVVPSISPDRSAINITGGDARRRLFREACNSTTFGARKAELNHGRRLRQPALQRLRRSYQYRRLASLNLRLLLQRMMHAAIDKPHFEMQTPPSQHSESYPAMMFSHRSTHSAKSD